MKRKEGREGGKALQKEKQGSLKFGPGLGSVSGQIHSRQCVREPETAAFFPWSAVPCSYSAAVHHEHDLSLKERWSECLCVLPHYKVIRGYDSFPVPLSRCSRISVNFGTWLERESLVLFVNSTVNCSSFSESTQLWARGVFLSVALWLRNSVKVLMPSLKLLLCNSWWDKETRYWLLRRNLALQESTMLLDIPLLLFKGLGSVRLEINT